MFVSFPGFQEFCSDAAIPDVSLWGERRRELCTTDFCPIRPFCVPRGCSFTSLTFEARACVGIDGVGACHQRQRSAWDEGSELCLSIHGSLENGMPEIPERRVLFHLNWHYVVLCAGLFCFGLLAVFVPWKNSHYGNARGYSFLWAPIDGCSVDLARQIMPLLFVMLATGAGVYLTRGISTWPILAPERASELPQLPLPTPAPAVVSPLSEGEPVDQPGIGGFIVVLLIAVVSAGIFISVVAVQYNGQKLQADERPSAKAAPVR